MIISELLPNPIGRDTTSEFIELLNNSATGVNLAGYILKDKSGKSYTLQGSLKSGEYLTLPYSMTKLNLNNTGDAIFIYDSSGGLVDKMEFLLQPKEGASYARREDGTFAFTDIVTPGAVNQFREVYPQRDNLLFKSPGEAVTHSLPSLEVIAIILILSIFISAFATYILKNAFHPKEYIL
ncbi:MAG TPA: lamin tail domain-containing protein [Candidatus Paceibacterota bacterium]